MDRRRLLRSMILISLGLSSLGQESCVPDCYVSGVQLAEGAKGFSGVTKVSEGTKVADPTSCYHYYICSDRTDTSLHFLPSDEPLRCEEGMYFMKEKPNMPSPPEIGCYAIPPGGLEDKCDVCNPCIVSCEGHKEGTLVPDPYDCTAFYFCKDSEDPVRFTCQNDEIFDYVTRSCGLAGNGTKCFDFCDPCRVLCVEEGKIPNPRDCRSYYYCEPLGGAALFPCGADQIFNKSTLLCEDDVGQACEPVCASEPEPSSGAMPALECSKLMLFLLALSMF